MPKLIKRLISYADNYNIEIIFVDSGSTDNSLKIIKEAKNIYPQIKLIQIKHEEFHYAKTRNFAVRKAKGKYIVFLSADALPNNKKMFDYILEDFNLSNRVQAVFCPHRPYKNTPLIQKIEQECYQERIIKYVKKSKILIQDIKNPFIPLNGDTEFVWYMLSNTCAIYRKSFLLKYPFPNINFGEDLALGKIIIKMGFIKIFDSRFFVIHSHIFNLSEYFQTERKFINSTYINLSLKKSLGLHCKIKKIFSYNIIFLKKIYYLFELFFYYLIKTFIFIQLKLSSTKNESPS